VAALGGGAFASRAATQGRPYGSFNRRSKAVPASRIGGRFLCVDTLRLRSAPYPLQGSRIRSMTAPPFLDPQLYWLGLEVEVRGFETVGAWAPSSLVDIQYAFCIARLKEPIDSYSTATSTATVTDAPNNRRCGSTQFSGCVADQRASPSAQC